MPVFQSCAPGTDPDLSGQNVVMKNALVRCVMPSYIVALPIQRAWYPKRDAKTSVRFA